jgi:uncharacterized membrane protein HdeD (DUF308 family)
MSILLDPPRPTAQRRRWRWFLGLGLALLALGVAALGSATLLELASVLVLGPLVLVSSAMQLMTAFMTEEKTEARLHYGAAALEAFLGFLVMGRPFESMASLAGVVAVFFVVIGLARLARSLAASSRRRAWAVLSGVVALLLGISLWLGQPAEALFFVAMCIAIDLLCHGVCWSAVAMAERRAPVTGATRFQ